MSESEMMVTKEKIIAYLKKNVVPDWYNEKYCLKSVKQNGYALQYVNKRTFGIK